MQMGSGGAAGGADLAEHAATRHLVADGDVDAGEVTEHADQPLAMVDKDGITVEEIVASQNDLACGGRFDGGAGSRGKIEA